MSNDNIDYLSQGSGEPVVFLHGIYGGAASFFEQIHLSSDDDDLDADFSEEDYLESEDTEHEFEVSNNTPSDQNLDGLKRYQRIAWNMPGYGERKAHDSPPTFSSLSESLSQFLTDLNLDKVHLVGQSIGGMLALEHAIVQPEQVASLTLIATTPSFELKGKSFRDSFLKARLALLDQGKTMADLAPVLSRKLVGPTASAETIEEIQILLANIEEPTWRGILECFVTFNRRNDLASIHQPCCVIAGGYDLNASVQAIQKMNKALPYSQLHTIEQAGHMVHQEFPEQTNQLLNQFLQKHTM